jgi:hypothetical protein
MADTSSEEFSFLSRQAFFVNIGLDLVFYGMATFSVAADSSCILDIGIYTTLVYSLLHYVFSTSFTLNLVQLLTASQQGRISRNRPPGF